MIEAAVRGILAADSGVLALVGSRVHAGPLPQGGAYPAVNMYLITHDPDNHLNGPGNLPHERIQINAWGSTYAAADGLIKAVDNAINAKSFSGTGYTCSIEGLIGGSYQFEPTVNVHRLSLDYGILFTLT